MNAAAILLLADKGLSAHDIAEVALAIEADQPKTDTAAARRRAWDRERKREQRESERLSGGMSGGSPPDPAPNERDNLTPTHERKTEAKASSKNGTGTRLPDDWKPKPLVEKTAEMVAAWPAGMIERELAKFKDHWLKTPGSRGRSLDWDASYRNWLRTADERKPRNDRQKQASLSNVVHRLLVNGGIDGGTGEDAGLGSANIDERGATRALASRSG